jgi:hypothetical protein
LNICAVLLGGSLGALSQFIYLVVPEKVIFSKKPDRPSVQDLFQLNLNG